MDRMELLRIAFSVSMIGCFIFLITGLALMVVWCVIGAFERRARNSSSRVEDYSVLATSRFTIPVSVVAPAYDEATVIVPVVQRLLALEYPTHEVIVVNDGSTDETLDRLTREFDLEPYDAPARPTFPHGEIRGVYRSALDPRLLVIDKVNGGKADALNCGTNFARFRYVCCVDGDTIYEPDALLKAMRVAMSDPARIIAVTSHFNPTTHPETIPPGADGDGAGIAGNWLARFQQLEYARSFLNSRLAWSRGNYMLNTSGAFMLYRRDVLEELGGFSPDFTCEDIELTFRAHEVFRREKRDYRIVSLPHTVGHTEVPGRVKPLISQRARWQRVTMETTWHHRRMFGNPRYGLVGLVGVPYFVFYECLSPFIELLALLTIPIAGVLGLLAWRDAGLAAIVLALVTGTLTNVSLLLYDDGLRRWRLHDLVQLMLAGPLELIVYRPLMLYARCLGAWQYFRGDKHWGKFERNTRPQPTSA